MSLKKQFVKAKHAYKVTFCLPQEAVNGAKEVELLGDFNNWDPAGAVPMKAKNGEFTATVELQPGQEYQFRYLADHETWLNDWEADKYVPTPFGVENSVVVAPDK